MTEQSERRPPLSNGAAAAYCGVSEGYLNKLRVNGGGPKFIKLPGIVLYSPDDLDEWLNRHKYDNTSQYERPKPALRAAE